MFRFLFLLFLIIPLVEIYLLIQVGSIIGAIPTIFLVVFTAVLGALLLRQQGFATIQRVQNSLAQGQMPAMALMEGMILLVSGALLLTPGFFTDAIGFLCLVPQLRRWMISHLLKRVVVSGFGYHAQGSGFRQPEEPGNRTIEGEYRRYDEK